MTFTALLHSSPPLLYASVLVLGLLVGSFLNVLIVRLPLMLDAGWRRDARELLEMDAPEEAPVATLWQPRSHCPQCRTPIAPLHNIPLLSWLLLRGRCAHCRATISIQYPLVEAGSALLSMLCAWRFGYSAELVAALLLSWTLLALAVIDLRTLLLPDSLTLPLLWLGLALSLLPMFAAPQAAIAGAIIGYLSLWALYWLFKLATGKEGMGYGDFKLLAALGAWLGWQALPAIVLLASIVAAAVGIGMIVLRGRDRQTPIPFGPYLAAAGWIVLMFGEQLQQGYWALVNPT